MTAIDRADWHYGGDFPKNLPKKNGGTHIGMYMNWMIDANLIRETFLEEVPEGIEHVKSGEITGRDFLFDYCDEKFLEDFLTEDGFEFTKRYYKRGIYTSDYQELLGSNYSSLYEIPDTLENYQRIAAKISTEFEKWKKKSQKKSWQFWKK
nr:hypothetical protein [uncultured Fluviicola sp.]